MSNDKLFSHPNSGHAARVEQSGREVRLIFVCHTVAKADDLADSIVAQLKSGALNLTLLGTPTDVIEEHR